MLKYLTFIFIFALSMETYAAGLQVIIYDKKNDPNQFYLIGASEGNYIIKSWQFNKSATWNGKGEPNLSISSAIKTAKQYLNKKEKLLLKEISLRPSFNKSGESVWYYYITFSKSPYKFNQKEFEVVVLSSGEIVAPYKR
jgi:hypothetical protein